MCWPLAHLSVRFRRDAEEKFTRVSSNSQKPARNDAEFAPLKKQLTRGVRRLVLHACLQDVALSHPAEQLCRS